MKPFASHSRGPVSWTLPFLLLPFVVISPGEGRILPSLGAGTALYDSDLKGLVNDNGSAGSESGLTALTDTEHVNGFTFNITFTPTAADLTGTVLLIELGGTSNGAGLFLVNGVPTVISKQNGTAAGSPDSLADSTLPAIAVQSPIGALTAGTTYSFSASWNHIRSLELIVEPENGTAVTTLFTLIGTPNNWSGNDTLSVGTIPSTTGSRGALSSGSIAPFGVNVLTSFSGTIQRALFWNEYSIESLEPVAPEIAGFSSTWLAGSNKVRLHWNLVNTGVPIATELVFTTGATELHRTTTESGFVDVPADRNGTFHLAATNIVGTANADSTVAPDTAYGTRVRQSAPIAWLRLTEPGGSGLYADSADNAAPHDAITRGVGNSAASGFVDGGVTLDGATALVSDLIIDPSTTETGYTIETVVLRHPGNSAATPAIVSQADGADGVGRVQLTVTEDGTIFSQLGAGVRREADAKLPANAWAHLALVVDAFNAELRWYLDGQYIGTTADGQNPDGTTFDPVVLLEKAIGSWNFGAGKAANGNFWKGAFDEIAVYDYLLDDPDANGNRTDSLIASHRDAWWNETSGIIHFGAVKPIIAGGTSTELVVKTGPEITSITIDHGLGTFTPVNGSVTVPITPATNTTYQVSATGPGGTTTANASVKVSDNTLLISPLNPGTALYDSDVRGLANDGETAGGQSGIPVLDDTHHVRGFTFNVVFTPSAADLTGTVLLSEIGGTSNGVSLVLLDGVPTLISKQTSSGAALPSSTNDTSLPIIAVQSPVGIVNAGTSYSFAATWNHLGTLELAVRPQGGAVTATPIRISGTPGNWSGNDTISVATPAPSSHGGFSTATGSPFSVASLRAFTGDLQRAVFWNSYSFISQPTAPSVEGFEATRLPGTGQVRLHWRVSEGQIPVPVDVVISSGGNQLHQTSDITGFVDVTADESATFSIAATSGAGNATGSTALPTENAFSTEIRASQPVAWYRFNGPTGSKLVADSAINAQPHDGSFAAGVALGTTGTVDGAATFDGSGGILTDFTYNPATSDPGFTIETLVRRRIPVGGGNDTRAIIGQQDLNGTGRNLLAATDQGRAFSFLAGKNTYAAQSLYRDGWAHLVLVVDALHQELRWYIDGQPAGSGVDPSLLIETTDGKWVIGSHKGLAQNFWLGDIDEVAVYDYLLDDPNGDSNLADSRVATHRGAWWNGTSGLIHAGSSSERVTAGTEVQLVVRVGPDVTSVTIDGLGTVVPVNGIATFTVTPGTTTTYAVTITSNSGTSTGSITVTVDPAAALQISSATRDGSDLVLSFKGSPNTTYQLLGSSSLLTFDQDLGPVSTGADGSGSARIPITAGSRFFRIQDIP
ncbi:LamG-like jellyroll fold domain-containing protein [Luteolibacter luteus]|uniref:LamG domain-containing protein n=1 Tax=Luteolibacter luteus TaxID=2728835 RepID=A0A858RGB0_9BACT|nr:LamG-like jellyroll fold domain-containing protein [Luteolibacter luteus]QJE95330.1 LamG domain-containing protein [Luteolibacter luteus]